MKAHRLPLFFKFIGFIVCIGISRADEVADALEKARENLIKAAEQCALTTVVNLGQENLQQPKIELLRQSETLDQNGHTGLTLAWTGLMTPVPQIIEQLDRRIADAIVFATIHITFRGTLDKAIWLYETKDAKNILIFKEWAPADEDQPNSKGRAWMMNWRISKTDNSVENTIMTVESAEIADVDLQKACSVLRFLEQRSATKEKEKPIRIK